MTLKIRLPKYQSSRRLWRAAIYDVVKAEAVRKSIMYTPQDQLQLHVRLYFKDAKLFSRVDVDNRLKDIMDALQGLFGGFGKKYRGVTAIIPNDKQIRQVSIIKLISPKQSLDLGHLKISKFDSGFLGHNT
jgi:hypothetical protein